LPSRIRAGTGAVMRSGFGNLKGAYCRRFRRRGPRQARLARAGAAGWHVRRRRAPAREMAFPSPFVARKRAPTDGCSRRLFRFRRRMSRRALPPPAVAGDAESDVHCGRALARQMPVPSGRVARKRAPTGGFSRALLIVRRCASRRALPSSAHAGDTGGDVHCRRARSRAKCLSCRVVSRASALPQMNFLARWSWSGGVLRGGRCRRQ